jgi:hypothetical protein
MKNSTTKMNMTAKYIIGSVSHDTMRPDDLIPAFLGALAELDPDKEKAIRTDEDNSAVFAILDTEDDKREDSDGEELDWFLNEVLFDLLNNYAPPYFYFGSHPGDGCDYGFWLSEGFEQDFEDNEGLRVSDTSEVPADYSGEVLHVSDHGNPTLYSAEDGKLTEVWALV